VCVIVEWMWNVECGMLNVECAVMVREDYWDLDILYLVDSS